MASIPAGRATGGRAVARGTGTFLVSLTLQLLFVAVKLGLAHESRIGRYRRRLGHDLGPDARRHGALLVEGHLLRALRLHHVVDGARHEGRHVHAGRAVRAEACLPLGAHVIRHLRLELVHWPLAHWESLMLVEAAAAIHHRVLLLAHHLIGAHAVLVSVVLASHHHRTLLLLLHRHLLLWQDRRPLEVSLHLHWKVRTLS